VTGAPVTVVVATRNRRDELLCSLGRILDLPESPPVIVVDNASTDGSADAIAARFPLVRVIRLEENLAAAARTIGVRAAATPYVAFADDDSWWAPGALACAVRLFERHPRLALLAGRIVVEPSGQADPVCQEMADSPLPRAADLPGPPILGFLACAAVVRRQPFLDVGGFHPRFGVGGEEALVAMDLAARGWGLAYVDEVVAHHQPSPIRDLIGRRQREVRNELWVAWLRLGLAEALRETAAVAARAVTDVAARRGLVSALAGLGWVLRERDIAPQRVRAALRLLTRGGPVSP